MRALHEFSADELISVLEERQMATIETEAEEARAKAKFEGVQGVLLASLKAEHPVEIAKRLMCQEEAYRAAQEEYLRAVIEYQKAKSAQHRADRALQLWQTVRADSRRI